MRINTFSILCFALLASACSKDNSSPASSSTSSSSPAAGTTPASASGPAMSQSALNFSIYGYHINALESSSIGNGVRAVTMALPANQGYESSVNVLLSSAVSMSDYVTKSRKGLDDSKFAIQGEKGPTASDWTVEYIGLVQGVAMHWYAHAVWSNGKIYLATATSPDVHWTLYGSALKACVDSLQVPGSSSSLNFSNFGFAINPLEAPLNDGTVRAVMMTLPDDRFPPNVNVMIQPATDGMASYQVKSKKEMDDAGLHITSATNPSPNEWNLEYIGLIRGTAVHWYARAVWKDGRVYLATAQVPDVMWNQYSDKLKKCVDSLQATGTEKVAPAPTGIPVPVTPAPATDSATTAAPAAGTANAAPAASTTPAAPAATTAAK